MQYCERFRGFSVILFAFRFILLRRGRLIGQLHIPKDELAAQLFLGQERLARFRILTSFGDNLHHPAVGNQPRGNLDDQASQVAQRPDDPDYHADDRHVSSQRDLAPDGH